MARWIRVTGKNAWAKLHRGGDDGKGSVRFDLGPCPTVSKTAFSLGGSIFWQLEEDDVPEVPVDTTKPPYRVPLVSEIRAVEPNGLTVMSTFSGCGGSCLGFEWAGYRPLLAVEFVPAAAEAYRENHPGVPVFTEDIRTLTAEAALETMGLKAGELDVLEGSPPCESFSSAGKLAAGWGEVRGYSDGKRQVMDDLFYEFTRLLGGIQPRAFVAENVSGLVRGVSKGYFKRIHAALAAQGYRVEARMLDAQWLGTPQRRKRVIFVGTRLDLEIAPAFPAPLPYRYSIRDALSGIGRVVHDTSGQHSVGELDLDAPVPTITNGVNGLNSTHFKVTDAPAEPEPVRIVYENGGRGGASEDGRSEEDLDAPVRAITKSHGAAHHFQVERAGADPAEPEDRAAHQARMIAEGVPLHGAYADAYPGMAPDRPVDGLGFEFVRSDGNKPVRTISRVGGASNRSTATHPDDPRKFSIPELRRLCGFPDDFILTGTYAQQWERLGNAVPPPMMYHVAAALRDALNA